jgi:hypothetical protein
MTTHKYAIGEVVAFNALSRRRAAAQGEYDVIAYRPVRDGEPFYIIKSALERHDRVVAESELQ